MSSHASPPRLDSPLADSQRGSSSRSTGTRKRSITSHEVKSPPPRNQSLDNLHTTRPAPSPRPNRSHTMDPTFMHSPDSSASRRKASSRDLPPIPSSSRSRSAHAGFPTGSLRTPNGTSGKYGVMPTTLSPISSSPSFTSSFSPSAGQGIISSSMPSTFSLLTTATDSFSTDHSFSISVSPTHRQATSASSGEPSPLATAYHAHTQLNSSHTHNVHTLTTPNLRMLHHHPGSRAVSAPASRKSSSGGSSDRELLGIVNGIGGTGVGSLDFKRLLSKPAMPAHSGGASIISLPSSDAELSPSRSSPRSGSRIGQRGHASQRLAHDSPSSSSSSPSNGLLAGGCGARQRNLSAPNPSASHSQTRERSSAAAVGKDYKNADDEGLKKGLPCASSSASQSYQHRPSRDPVMDSGSSKSRNVLKRRSSPSTPTVATFRAAGALSESSSSHSTSRPCSSKPTIRSAGGAPPSPRVSSRREEVVVDPVIPSPRSSLKPRDLPPPPGLTPAGAVAHAYKQQEQRREELAEISGWSAGQKQREKMSSIRAHSHHRSSDLAYLAASGGEEEEGEEASRGPYYTVFGSTSGKLVAVGGPQDSTWDLSYDGYIGGASVGGAGVNGGEERKKGGGSKSGTTTPSGSMSSGVKSLTRKVSGRFKKVAGVGKSHRENSPHARSDVVFVNGGDGGWAPHDGRVSLQKESTSSLLAQGRASIDANVREVGGMVEKEADAGCGGSGRALRPMRSFRYDEDNRHKPREEEASPGGKLWKLMKRISTGGLREKYTRELSEPPPVPALPKDLQTLPPSRMTLDITKPPERERVNESGVLLSRFMQSRTSLSGVRPSMGSSHKSTVSRPSTGKGSGSPSGHRPSTTTRSSSPMSSDIASSRFFHKPHSNRSSTSSYGEELPPLPISGSPTKGIGQHILAPSELHKFDKGAGPLSIPQVLQASKKHRKSARSRSMPGDESFNSPADDLRPSLPHPPRRSATAGSKTDAPPSPTIPTFSTTEAVNNFNLPGGTLSMSEFGVAVPVEGAPPRPKRNSRRHVPPELTTSPSSPLGPASPPIPVTPRTPLLPSLHVDFFHQKRKSVSSSFRSPSSTKDSIPSPSPASARSPLTFKEIESPRHAWTEKEKADKWDDLLERSDRAGGTLHLGGDVGSGLMSDNLRYSVSICSDIES